MKQKLVVYTGAGIIAESGIPTFGDKNGIWGKYDAMKLASVEGFEEDPQAVLDFYNACRKNLLEVKPNHAHCVLADLEKQYDVTIITQNVDNLHERAGSSKVIHLHGELTKVTSSRNRSDSSCIKDYPLDIPIRIGDKATDSSQLRPYIVWLGEYDDNWELAEYLVKNTDIFVVIGTPLVYYPVAGLVKFAHREIPRYLVDPFDIREYFATIAEVVLHSKSSEFDRLRARVPLKFEHIKAKAIEGVDELVRRLEGMNG